jgi:hypothetical protein
MRRFGDAFERDRGVTVRREEIQRRRAHGHFNVSVARAPATMRQLAERHLRPEFAVGCIASDSVDFRTRQTEDFDPLGDRQLKHVRDAFERPHRHCRDACFKLRVPLCTDVGEFSDVLATQTWRPPFTRRVHTQVRGADAAARVSEKFTELRASRGAVHRIHAAPMHPPRRDVATDRLPLEYTATDLAGRHVVPATLKTASIHRPPRLGKLSEEALE